MNRVSTKGDCSLDSCQEMSRDMERCEEDHISCLKGVEVMLKQIYTVVNVCGLLDQIQHPKELVSLERVRLIEIFFSYSSHLK